MAFRIYKHEFCDGSGTVLFDQVTGETIVFSLKLKELIEELKNPQSALYTEFKTIDILSIAEQENILEYQSVTNGI